MDGSWDEVGDRVWTRTHGPFDTAVGLVAGSDGLLLVDPESGAGADLPIQGRVRWLVNTHGHSGHIGGNTAFPGATVHRHESIEGEARTFASIAYVDLGDRQVELAHPGPGHTAGDVVVRVPDADVLFMGDLVLGNGPPAYGPDCFPIEWPKALEVVLGLLTGTSVAVPGHGAPTDREFVSDLIADVAAVADTLEHLASQGVRPEDALAATEWPFPRETLVDAVRRGYEHLGGPAPPRLPLLPS